MKLFLNLCLASAAVDLESAFVRWGVVLSTMSSADASSDTQAGRTSVNSHGPEREGMQSSSEKAQRKKVVVVGLGMVGVAFM